MACETFTITFLRHGESVGNLENRHQGQADFPLTPTGRDQARLLAERWKAEGRSFDRAVSSPLLRARETAEIVCTALGLPLEFDPDWMEMNNGLLAGMDVEAARAAVPPPAFSTPYTRAGRTGESRWEVYLRAGRALQRLVEGPPASLLVVAHGGVLNMAMYAILSIPVQADFAGPRFQFDNTTFTTLLYDPQRHIWRLLHFDDRPHLRGQA